METTSLGAGMRAAAAIGWFDSISEAADAMSGEGVSYAPDERRAELYGRLLEVYREIYPSVSKVFPRLRAALQRAPDAASYS